jgi:hypothetical protein
MAIAWIVFKENVDRRLLAGALAILAGAVLLSWQGGPAGVGLGALAIVGACFAWAIDNNMTRKLSSADPVQIAAIKGIAAGTVNLALAFAHGAAFPAGPAIAGASAWSCSFWRFDTSERRARARISPRRLSWARPWRWRCSTSRLRSNSPARPSSWRSAFICICQSATSMRISMRRWTTTIATSTTSITSMSTAGPTRRASHTLTLTIMPRCGTNIRTTLTCIIGTATRTRMSVPDFELGSER